MKKRITLLLAVIASLTLSLVQPADAKVKLPVLVSDGMVLQHGQNINIWGWANPQEDVTVTFLKKKYKTIASPEGKWTISIPPQKAGGPHKMTVNDIEINNILLGDVWLCSGQSNMETTIERIMDMFADEVLSYENTNIRYVKLQHDHSFQGPKEDVKPTTWKPVTQEHVKLMAGVPYFFAKYLYEDKQIPIGIVNTAVGGSAAEAWVAEEYLNEFPHLLIDKEICEAEGYIELTQKLQSLRSRLYHQKLNENDHGLKENWKSATLDDSDWTTTNMFGNWASDGVNWINGSHWFRKEIEVPTHLAGQKAELRLGCIVDSDSVFVNGTFVGTTSYQYPPRIYPIPEGLLKEGKNNITIRLFCAGGRAHFVEDKPYKVIFANEEISLLGTWKHRVGCRMFALPGGVGFSNKATVLYNSLIAPLKNMTFKGVLWYQGETNTGRYNEYYGIISALIKNWRDLFDTPELPFIIAQLPNFMQQRNYPSDGGWAQLRNVQKQLSQDIPNVGLTVNIDLGEWNDIHPLNKKDVGYRIFLQAQKLVYGKKGIVADGPIYESAEVKGNQIILSFKEGTNNLMPVDELKGFTIAGKDGRYQWAKARIEGNKVIVWSDAITHPVSVRYAWADNPGDVNLRNTAGLPASPFETK